MSAEKFIQKEATLKLERTDRQVIEIIIKNKSIVEEAFVRKISNKHSHKKKISNDISDEIINDYLINFLHQ